MSVTQPPKDTPFGLEPNLAAGLAYLFCLLGGIVMLVGGGTNRFVKWAAAQSIVIWGSWLVIWWVLGILAHAWVFLPLIWLVAFILPFLGLVVWLWTFISAFQGKEVEVPVLAGWTRSIFKSQLE
ncbi:MAG: hypothetical protein JO092_09500 [Candidatus Eremiobacteraeota bacterium]|nr:hypothetical protein [Candidatus Eremiobacteraeota bacterium]MBV8531542.1 hypothetical protein [Candidatus Eremiobacteraeota bacterium]